MSKRELVFISPEDLSERVVAEFELVGNQVRAEYFHPAAIKMIERDGACVATGTFRPRDGKLFWDAVYIAFSRSTFVYVRDAG